VTGNERLLANPPPAPTATKCATAYCARPYQLSRIAG
jgi:hypothetical protein